MITQYVQHTHIIIIIIIIIIIKWRYYKHERLSLVTL